MGDDDGVPACQVSEGSYVKLEMTTAAHDRDGDDPVPGDEEEEEQEDTYDMGKERRRRRRRLFVGKVQDLMVDELAMTAG